MWACGKDWMRGEGREMGWMWIGELELELELLGAGEEVSVVQSSQCGKPQPAIPLVE